MVISEASNRYVDRKMAMSQYIKEQGFCTIDELVEKFSISRVTVHRVLNQLKEERVVSKVRGGAKPYAYEVETRFTIRVKANSEKKREIARNALELIDDGDLIFLEASSTCLYLANEIAKRGYQELTVITNSPAIGEALAHKAGISVIMTGGEFHTELNTLGGPLALYAIEKLQFKKVFLSALAISEKGVMTSVSLLLDIKKKLVDDNRELNLLIDSSKFSNLAPLVALQIHQLRRVVTDKAVPQEMVQKYENLGVEVIY